MEKNKEYTKDYVKQEISEDRAEQSDDELALARQTYKRFDELKRAKTDVAGQNIEDIWDQNEKNLTNYSGDMPSDDERSNLFIPITHATIDTLLSEWIRQHSSGRVVPSEDPEDEPKAELVQFCIEYIQRKNNIEKVDMDTHYDTVGPIGNGIQKIYYKVQNRKVRTISKVNPDGTKEYTETIKKDWDDICIEKVDCRMFYPGSGAKEPDFSDMDDCMERKILTYSRFEVEYDEYPNTKVVKRGGDIVKNDFFKKPEDMEDEDVEVLIWHNKVNDFRRIVANGIFLDDRPLPDDHKELPFVGTYDTKRGTNQFWNMSTAEIMASLQDEVNTNRNIVSDGQKLSTLKMYWVPKTGALEDDELIAEPGKFYLYNGIQPPTAIDVGTDFTSMYMMEDKLKDDIVTTTGVDRKPQSEGPSETATSVAVKKEATLKRIAKKIYQNQILLEKRRGELLVSLIMQYYTTSKFEKIAGKEKIKEYEGKDGFKTTSEGVYKRQSKKIRIDNKEVKVDPQRKGEKLVGVKLDIREKKGYSFFNVTPELIKGKYDYVVVPDIDIPITKAQEIEISSQLYDRLSGNPVINSPDGKMYVEGPNGQLVAKPMPKGIIKLTENILKKHGYNIQDFLPDETTADPMLEQAMKENVVMLQGEALGPTPLASPEHSQVHSQFMDQNVDESTPEIMQIFNEHILGETEFQKKIAQQDKIKSYIGGGTRGSEQTNNGGA